MGTAFNLNEHTRQYALPTDTGAVPVVEVYEGTGHL
jgi:hypothetical protein